MKKFQIILKINVDVDENFSQESYDNFVLPAFIKEDKVYRPIIGFEVENPDGTFKDFTNEFELREFGISIEEYVERDIIDTDSE